MLYMKKVNSKKAAAPKVVLSPRITLIINEEIQPKIMLFMASKHFNHRQQSAALNVLIEAGLKAEGF